MKKTRNNNIISIALTAVSFLCACSSTSNLPENETLYTGLKEIKYEPNGEGEALPAVKEEIEAALACAPNGAFLGSSYYKTPFPVKLWIYNKYANSTSKFGNWIKNSFGSEPILMSYVNPEMRAKVATNILRNNGYFNANVGYSIIPQKNPKKEKLSYNITLNHLYTIDTLKYVSFPEGTDSIIISTADNARIKSGEPFAVSQLDAERTRISNLLRNNGYYFYKAGYSTFLADSVSIPGKVEVRMQPIGNLPEEAGRKWYLGNMKLELRRSVTEQPTDSFVHPRFKLLYSGKKPPIRIKALLRDLKLKRGQMFSQNNYVESANILNSMGLFTMSDFAFTPRDTSATCDTLDMSLTCIFDKPLDASIEANYSIKTNDRTGPGLVLGLTKRNAFRGGEKLTLNLKGSYEWQTGKKVNGNSSKINSYEYGADVSLEYPRIEAPFGWFGRRRFHVPPSTLFSLSGNVLNRAKYFKMLTVTGAVTYKFQTSANSRHELSPFLLDYNYLQNTTATFDSIADRNPAIYMPMRNQFIPKIKYTYTYTSPATYKNPIVWETTVTEAGNVLSMAYVAANKGFNTKEKNLFGNPFAQFLKLNTSLRKTWRTGLKSQLVGRVAGGIIWAYGNSERAPYTEQFYVGGANSIRAFTIRSIGPGKYVAPSTTYAYLDQTGDIKLEMNLEYRFNIIGSLYGAAFIDTGNIWLMKKDENRPDSEFRIESFFKQLALGTGAGLRYDLDFFVLRLDLGIALHVPYETGKGGYYNIPKFKDGLGFHFAIGYPF